MSKGLRKFSVAAATLATLCFSSSYAQVPMDLSGLNSTYIQPETITFDGNTSSVYTGAITGTLNGGVSQFFFCYDLSHVINVPGNYLVNITSPSTPNLPSYLQLAPTWNLEVASSLLNNANIAGFGTDTAKYSGLQLAVWSILNNWQQGNSATYTLNGSVFSTSATGNVLTDAMNFLALAGNYTSDPSGSFGSWNLMINANDSPGNVVQTLVGMTVPEPGTYILLGSFLGIVFLAFKRRQRLSL